MVKWILKGFLMLFRNEIIEYEIMFWFLIFRFGMENYLCGFCRK